MNVYQFTTPRLSLRVRLQAMHCDRGPGRYIRTQFPEAFQRVCTALYHATLYLTARNIKAKQNVLLPLLRHLLHVLRTPVVEAELRGLTAFASPPDSALRALAIAQAQVMGPVGPAHAEAQVAKQTRFVAYSTLL